MILPEIHYVKTLKINVDDSMDTVGEPFFIENEIKNKVTEKTTTDLENGVVSDYVTPPMQAYVNMVEPENVNCNEKVVIDDVEIQNVCSSRESHPEFISVYCVATLDNCPDNILSQEYGDSIRRFLSSEHHLKDNIVSSDLQHLSTKLTSNNTYVHTVSIVLSVKTARLWESPAKYVRKYLGLDNFWTRSNGTVVKLSRIHQKD